MNILWLNWKDIRNPEAGGAEVFTHEIAKRLVSNGFDVTLFTSKFNAKGEEIIDGVKIVRRGNRYTVYRNAKRYYEKNESFDLVIDEINTIPFLTPKYCKKPIIALIHQLAREYWFYETSFPINMLGYYILEYRWLKHYVDIDTLVISNSTRDDLIKLGFKHIHLLPQGLSITPLNCIPEKEAKPTLLFVGRLERAKRPKDAIKVFEIVKSEIPNVQLWIVGDGYLLDDLKRSSSPYIKFFGRISEEVKIELMKRAHILLVPSVREGWGLVVTEANALATIAIAYDVHGLRDAIRDRVTGRLVKFNDIDSMAHATIELLKDKITYNLYAKNALEFASNFSWDETAKGFIDIINRIYRLYLNKIAKFI